MLANPFIPVTPTTKQAVFLALPVREALYGGAAGGGKSVALLAGALQYVDRPHYRALLLRRTYADLNLPEALIPLSQQWLQGTGAKWNGNLNEWTFPSGATVTFGYLQTEIDKYRYQGAAFQYIGFDELTQFTDTQYRYLFSRLRRSVDTHGDIPLRMRSASNPGGSGHTWVKTRFFDTTDAKRVFVSARLEDNPHLDREQYDVSLSELDPVTRHQLRYGDWDIVADGVFKRDWFRYHRREGDGYRLYAKGGGHRFVKAADCHRFATADIAGTADTREGDPDYTVIQVWDLTPTYDLILVDQWRERREVPDVEDAIVLMHHRYECEAVGVEHAGIGLGVIQSVRRRGVPVIPLKTKGKGKLARSQTAQIRMEGGTVYLPSDAAWLAELEAELLTFKGDDEGHDDQVDALSYAAQYAQRKGGPLKSTLDRVRAMVSDQLYEEEEAKADAEAVPVARPVRLAQPGWVDETEWTTL